MELLNLIPFMAFINIAVCAALSKLVNIEERLELHYLHFVSLIH